MTRKVERNVAVVAAAADGATLRHIAAVHGISPTRVAEIVNQAKGLTRCTNNGKHGRPTIWPVCPGHLRDRYLRLRKAIGSHEARRRIVLNEALKAAIARDRAVPIIPLAAENDWR